MPDPNSADKAFMEIFNRRRSLVKNLQPVVDGVVTSMSEVVRRKLSHPYSGLPDEIWEEMVESTGKGPEARPPKKTTWLYRIHGPKTVHPPIEFGAGDVRTFSRLGEYFSGPISSHNGTFWTCRDLEQGMSTPEALIDAVLRLGMFEAWPEHFLLRIPLARAFELGLTVPTEADGFDHFPYLPRPFKPTPAFGTTLDLSLTPTLGPGWNEYIIKDVQAEDVEFIAIKLNDSEFGRAKRKLYANPVDTEDSGLLLPKDKLALGVLQHLSASFP